MEQFSNIGSAVLNGAINNSVTSLTVSSPVNNPSTGTFRARIDNEVIKVTAVSGSTWTISRADASTTAASHADQAVIYIIVTKEALDAIVTVQSAGSEISNRRILNFVSGATVADNSGNSRADITIIQGIPWENALTTPVAGNFAWVNQGSATLTTTSKNCLFLYAPPVSGNNMRIQKQTRPGSNWTCIMRADIAMMDISSNNAGFVIRDPGTGKMYSFYRLVDRYQIAHMTDASNWSGTDVDIQFTDKADRSAWWKFVYTNSSTNVTWSRSQDGESWVQIYTGLTVSNQLASPTEIGFFAESNNSTYGVGMLLQSWATSSP